MSEQLQRQAKVLVPSLDALLSPPALKPSDRELWSAVGQSYPGMFSTWTLEESDRQEVLAYRAGLSVAAAALVLETAITLLPPDSGLREATRRASCLQSATAGLAQIHWFSAINSFPEHVQGAAKRPCCHWSLWPGCFISANPHLCDTAQALPAGAVCLGMLWRLVYHANKCKFMLTTDAQHDSALQYMSSKVIGMQR